MFVLLVWNGVTIFANFWICPPAPVPSKGFPLDVPWAITEVYEP